jgi:hypothetical protein
VRKSGLRPPPSSPAGDFSPDGGTRPADFASQTRPTEAFPLSAFRSALFLESGAHIATYQILENYAAQQDSVSGGNKRKSKGYGDGLRVSLALGIIMNRTIHVRFF